MIVSQSIDKCFPLDKFKMQNTIFSKYSQNLINYNGSILDLRQTALFKDYSPLHYIYYFKNGTKKDYCNQLIGIIKFNEITNENKDPIRYTSFQISCDKKEDSYLYFAWSENESSQFGINIAHFETTEPFLSMNDNYVGKYKLSFNKEFIAIESCITINNRINLDYWLWKCENYVENRRTNYWSKRIIISVCCIILYVGFGIYRFLHLP